MERLRFVAGLVLAMMIAGATPAQRPRTITQDKAETAANVPPPPPAPQTVKADRKSVV